MTKQSTAERIEFNNCLDNLRWAMENEAPLSNRGCIKYKPKLKTLREVRFSDDYRRDDFKFLSKGFDSLQEAFNFRVKEHIEKLITSKKREAETADHEISLGLNLPFWGDFQVFARGACGVKYILKNEKIEILISSFSAEWGISVRYLSASLWQFGTNEMRLHVHSLLNEWSKEPLQGKDYHRLSRADVCIDFMSKKMRNFMKPNILEGIVMPQKVKNNVVGTSGKETDDKFFGVTRGGYFQTLTLGGRSSLQLQIYDKAQEISESSKKTWFYELWSREAPELKDGIKKDVWRFEARFFSPFLRNRMIRTFDEFMQYWTPLISEALSIRRLSVPNASDKNRSRWALHPIYCFLFDAFSVGTFSLPVGRFLLGTKEAAQSRASKQLAGTLLSYSVLFNHGIFDDFGLSKVLQSARIDLRLDRRKNEKIERARERYKFLEAA